MTNERQDPANTPRDAKLLSLLLQSLDIPDHDPNVIHLLLKFIHSYTSSILSEASLYAQHCGRSEIQLQDVVLAINQTVQSSFTRPPDVEFLTEIAKEKNKVPLPIIPEKFGVRTPPDRYALTGVNFSVTANGDEKIKEQPDSQRISYPNAFLPYHQAQYRPGQGPRPMFNPQLVRPGMQPHYGGYIARPQGVPGARPMMPGMSMPGNMYQRPHSSFNANAPVQFRPVAPVVAPRPLASGQDDDYD